MKADRLLSLFLFFFVSRSLLYSTEKQDFFSVAGFYSLKDSGREVYSMNQAWRFYKGDIKDAQMSHFDDTGWGLVSIPHGLEYLPEEASGDRNYQGKVWYRKHFDINEKMRGKKVFLHFEAIMGKSVIWVNGVLVKEHYGGYLPIIVDVSDFIEYGKENIVAVLADNSNDPLYPPGKSQQIMDFAYLGGIYRDCWLVVHDQLYVTDPNYEKKVAGGGTLVWYENVGKKKADVCIKLHLRNERKNNFQGSVSFEISDCMGQRKGISERAIHIISGQDASLNQTLTVLDPDLWSPENPNLYWLTVRIIDRKKNVVDGYRLRIGIRSIELKGEDGLWLNGEPYPYKLMGVNRHQDFAIIGNAMPNSLHYRDASRLKSAGVRIVRSAHYPQDPAFMDACDELGIFVIVATPSWQFWNNNPVFGQRVYSDIRNMVRRDRNHPSVFMWEPILNETHYPDTFALNALRCVNEEYPTAYSASDPHNKTSANFQVIYSAPNAKKGNAAHVANEDRVKDKVYFTREWGDNVDDWSSNNSPSRVHRSWGEAAMLVQAQHYAKPPYEFTCLETFYNTTRQQIGGTIWCGFDHSRGYHPQNFFGGIMDSYRQPKYSYYMLMSQRLAAKNEKINVQTGPMIYIPHELSPFSAPDVVVYSNCEEVRLTVFEKGKTYSYKRSENKLKMPSPIITFKNVYDFMELKRLARSNRRKEIYLLAEGISNGKVVASHKVYSSLKPTKLRLRIDNDNRPLVADGSDVIVVVAELIDEMGNIKRLNNDYVHFEIEGEGKLLQNAPGKLQKLDWGTAPILVQSSYTPGVIKLKVGLEVQGLSTAKPTILEIKTVASDMNFISSQKEVSRWTNLMLSKTVQSHLGEKNLVPSKKQTNFNKELEQVARQQTEFSE